MISLVSFGLSEWGWRNHPNANFYWAPTRAWELLAGAICAFYLFEKKVIEGNNWLSLSGLTLIIYSIFAFDKNTPFPSGYTLVPVLGAVLIILFGTQRTIVSRILSTPWFVGVGLISYSAYLWHHALFAFARIKSVAEPSQITFLLLGILTLLLAGISWRFVEQPFRSRQIVSSQKVLAIGIGVTLLVLSIGVAGQLTIGYEASFLKRLAKSEADAYLRINKAREWPARLYDNSDCKFHSF